MMKTDYGDYSDTRFEDLQKYPILCDNCRRELTAEEYQFWSMSDAALVQCPECLKLLEDK